MTNDGPHSDPKLPEWPRMRSPMGMLHTRLSGRANVINNLLAYGPMLPALALIVYGGHSGMPWLIAPGLGLIAAGLLLSHRHFKRAWKEQRTHDDTQADVLLAGEAPVLLQRRFAFGWPVALTLMCGIFLTIAIAADFSPIPAAIAVLLAAICLVAWWVATRRARPFGSLSAAGLLLQDTLIPWSAVASVDSQRGYRSEGAMIVNVFEREPVRALLEGRGSWRWRGETDREIRVPFTKLQVPAAVILQLAEEFCRRVRNERARAAAERKRAQFQQRLAANPEQAKREFQQEFDGFMRDTREALDRLKALEQEAVKTSPASIWRGAPGSLPMKVQWMLVVSVAIAVAVAVYGMKAHFYKSPLWSQWNLFVSLGVAALISVWGLVKLLPRAARGRRSVAAFAVTFIAVTLAWGIVSNALPDLYTRFAGRPFTVVQQMRVQADGRDGCAARVHASLFEAGHVKPYYCASNAEFARLPASGPIEAHGTESWFGRHVDFVAPADPTFHSVQSP